MAAKEWHLAFTVLRSITKIDPDYRDARQLEPMLKFLKEVNNDLRKGILSSAVMRITSHKLIEDDPVIHGIIYEVSQCAIEADAWESVKAILESLSKRDFSLLLKEYNLPYIEIRGKDLIAKPKSLNRYFSDTWKNVANLKIVNAGLSELFSSSTYRIFASFPQNGVFHKKSLPDNIKYEHVKQDNMICGLLICRANQPTQQAKRQ
jgi:hypothetical protein